MNVTNMVRTLVDTPLAIIGKAKQAMAVKSSLKCEQQSNAERCGEGPGED